MFNIKEREPGLQPYNGSHVAMRLYPEAAENGFKRNIQRIRRILPEKVLVSEDKKGSYFESFSSYIDLYPFIRYNSEDRIDVLIVDVDKSEDAGEWMDVGLPHPTWIVHTTRGYHAAWVLKKPIFISEQNKHAERDYTYVYDVLKKIVYALDADRNAMSFNQVFRNPMYVKAQSIVRFDLEYDLKDFRELEAPPRDWGKRETINAEEGIGRNCTLFDLCRIDAYAMMKQSRYSVDLLESRANSYNEEFGEMLPDKEVQQIVKSIDKFMITKYDAGSFYMKNTTPEERREIASKNGTKGAKKKRELAYAKIQATIVQMESFDIKITVSDVARRAKSDPKTVRAFFKEKGWKEVSRKEGWKQYITI